MNALALFSLLSVSAQAPAPSEVPAVEATVVEERPRLLVLDLRNDGIDEGAARALRDGLVAHLGTDGRVEVVSTEEMRRALALEGEKQAAGCDPDGASCLAELAQALDAAYVLSGSVGRVGTLHIVTLSVADGRKGTMLSRESFEAQSVEALPALMRPAGDRALATALGGTSAAVDAQGGNPMLLWTGVSVAGLAGAVAVGTGVFATLAFLDVDNQPEFTGKQNSYGTGVYLATVAGIAAGVAVVGLGGAGLALVLE